MTQSPQGAYAVRLASLGWRLPHPRIVELAPLPVADWPLARVLLLGADAASRLWSRAVGQPVRSFRAAALERAAWSEAVAWLDYVERCLAAGGRLIVRLELPGARCRVAQPPCDRRFPVGSPLSAYDLLAAMHPAMRWWANRAGAVAPGSARLAERCGYQPGLSDYLDEFHAETSPQTAVAAPLPSDWQALAQTADGHCCAWTTGRLAGLPTLADVDPECEARVLVAAATAWQGEPSESFPAARWG